MKEHIVINKFVKMIVLVKEIVLIGNVNVIKDGKVLIVIEKAVMKNA
jgi:hypothetical protein